MTLSRGGYLVVAVVLALFAIVTALVLASPGSGDPSRLLLRLLGLYGYLSLSLAAILTLYLRDIYKLFGRPFLKVHHTFAAFGLAAITLHPVVLAVRIASPRIFVPDITSWDGFWINAGRPALIVIYIALAAALIRTRIPTFWKHLHLLMVAALTFAIVHANLIGTDFQYASIALLYNGLFAVVIGAIVVKHTTARAQRPAEPAKKSR